MSQAADAFQQNWFHKSLYPFPPFCTIPKIFEQSPERSWVLGLQHLDIKFMTKGTFPFGKLHKTWRRGKSPDLLNVYSFWKDT